MGYKCLLLFIVITLPLLSFAQKDTAKRLKAVEITDKRGDFGFMRQVEGMKLTAGKKTELINVEQLTVNKSTNNPRQVYAKVSGLNIFENDGSGLQLSIGGRGLDPNRTSNFNVRQNGYDISADALGYPESYYTPPTEALKKIEVIKGAAGLQYGTQFGGLLNFQMKQPDDYDEPITLETRQTMGSWGYLGSYNSIGGKVGKLNYFGYVQFKQGNGWRPNSKYHSLNAYTNLRYHLTEKNTIGLELTHLNYLAQQPGGLDDKMFAADPRQSNRPRNWFAVKWNLMELEWDYKISGRTRLQTKAYGLLASRDAVGFRPNRPSQPDNGGTRDLLKGTFQNIASESRLLHRYTIGKQYQTLLIGARVYKGQTTGKQGAVNNGDDANFNFIDETNELSSDYTFPNLNIAAFAEHIFRIGSKTTISPGARIEHIHTKADGMYRNRVLDFRDSVISDIQVFENKDRPRTLLLMAMGIGRKLSANADLYSNISQNYRSVTFSDIQIINPSFEIDPAIRDEKGWNADLGVRGNINNTLRYDANVFFMYYGNRIGEYFYTKSNKTVIRRRGNVGVANIYGLESFLELDVLKLIGADNSTKKLALYSNLALTEARYTKSPLQNVQGKQVEYVPHINWKTGIQTGYKNLKFTLQFSALSDQYSDATNAPSSGYSAVNGIIPAYQVADFSAAYRWHKFTIEGSINNLLNVAYFTRRATGYPGPGIIPGEGRSFYLTLGAKL